MGKEVKNNPQLDATKKQEGLSRRTFLSSTGGAALAVAATGLLNDRAVAQPSAVPATEKTADKPPVPAKAAVSKMGTVPKYPNLLSPMKVGNHILRNRIIGSASGAHLLQGPDPSPTQEIMIHHANTARAGAAIVVISQPLKIHPDPDQTDVLKPGSNPFITWDIANTGTRNMLSQLTEGVHFYGSLCFWKADIRPPSGYDVSVTSVGHGIDSEKEERGGGQAKAKSSSEQPPQAFPEKKELTEEMLKAIIDNAAEQALLGKEGCGFDGIWLHCGYRGAPTARLMSPLTNHRTDKYGGSLENRARFTIELCDAIKKKCGKDFLIMAIMSGEEPKGGYTLDDGAEFAKLFTGHMDLLALKGDTGSVNSPDNFVTGPDKYTPNLYMTEYYKKKGVTIPLISDGGFTDMELAEKALAAGKTDAVGMCRALITNRNFMQLALEGRNEDVRPCIRCNGCHINGQAYTPWNQTPWNSICYVNPTFGMEHKIDKMVSPPTDKKKVAIIGGGPSGMEAALIAAERGHSVTLFEKTGRLGGAFKTFEKVSFKWPHTDFKNYMVRQIGKSNVTVRMNTEATPEMIKKEGFNAVLVAIGAEPILPDIPGAKGKNVVQVTDVYGKEDTLAKNVVVIGGGQTGVETAMHLEEQGHIVTVLEESAVLARDAVRVHFYEEFQQALSKHVNCKVILQARCNKISETGATYVDSDGKEQSIQAGSVVLAVGMKAKSGQALKFYGSSAGFYTIGDCRLAGDLRTAMRSAFGVASQL